jgi:hypothetical protein
MFIPTPRDTRLSDYPPTSEQREANAAYIRHLRAKKVWRTRRTNANKLDKPNLLKG